MSLFPGTPHLRFHSIISPYRSMFSEDARSLSPSSLFGAPSPNTRHPTRLHTDTLDSSLIRFSVPKSGRHDFSLQNLLSIVSKFGEIQSIDMSRFQFDSTFAVSYFDIRAASYARSSIGEETGSFFEIAEERSRCNSYIEHFEEVPHSCSISGRCITVSGFPTCDSTYKDVLLSVFGKFGEIETITHNSIDEFKVAFFDSRTPLAIQAILHPDRTYSDHIKVSSDELLPLLLAGASMESTPAIDQKTRVRSKTEDSDSGDSGKTPRAEFAIDMYQLESGKERRTTVMIRNIPRSFTQQTIGDIIKKRFMIRKRQQYNDDEPIFDFIYLPMDLVNRVNVGYVFINFTRPEYVVHSLRFLNGKTWRNILESVGSDRSQDQEITKVARVTFARLQGKDALMEHFSKSSIMHNQPQSIRPLFL